jgi:hypothetical protein
MNEATTTASESVAERLAARIAAVRAGSLPEPVRQQVDRLVLDVAGLCIAARKTDYVAAVTRALDAGGPCTAIGHP